MNKITVLLSSYNGEKYIREQIDTILTQNILGLCLFVRDDGSSDTTCDILEEYASKGKLEWFKGENKIIYKSVYTKIGFSFLDLIKKAPESEFYAFADQDDIWLPNKLSEAIKLIEQQNQNIPLLYCSNYTEVDTDGKFIKEKQNKFKPKELKINRILVNPLAPGCTFVFNKNTHNLFAQYDQPYMYIHDFTLTKIVATFGKVIFDNRSFIKYRQHNNNVIGSKNKTLLQKINNKLKNKSKASYDYDAENILNQYSYEMDKKTKKQYAMLAYYRKNFKTKIALIFSSKIRRNKFVENIFFKVAILFNLV